VHAFRNAVRLRDRRCIITGKVALGAQYGTWRGFEAAHIFPLAYEEHWRNNNFARWISIPPITGGTINSIQNGMLLRSDIHELFDSFAFSINPDVRIYILYFL
jgi:predicted restriction endonuclease